MSRAVTRLDPHVKILDERVVDRAKRRGVDAIVYAPHFQRLPTIEDRAAAASDAELTVLPAREIFAGPWHERRHVLALGLEAPVPDFIPLEVVLDECARQGAAVLVPHPTFMTVSLTTDEIHRHRDRIDALETYNPKFLPHHRRRAVQIAEREALPTFGSTYAHLHTTVGEVWTELEVAVESIDELQHAIDEDRLGPVRHRTGCSHRLRRGLEFGHLFWENSWEKLDRVVRAGVEPTHPRHPAYEGRFDDVAVY